MAATSHTQDYLGRSLANATPGTTNPVFDYLGREIDDPDEPDDALVVNETDYLGRSLQGA